MKRVYSTFRDNFGSDKVAIINQGSASRSGTAADSDLYKPSQGRIPRTKEGKIQAIFERYKILIDTMYKYPWLNSSISHIAKSVVGSGYSLTLADLSEGKNSSVDSKEKSIERYLESKYLQKSSKFHNVKDLMTFSSKLTQTIIYYILFGYAAWETIFDDRGAASGFDFASELVIPNFRKNGDFKNPAYLGYPYFRDEPKEPSTYETPEKIVYFVNPAINGEFVGRTFLESLTNYVIPADIYAAYTYLNLHKNYSKPSGIWTVPNVDRDEFKRFTQQLDQKYKGYENYGQSAIAVRGQVDFKEFRSPAKDDMPYIEGRKYSRNELATVLGVPTAMLGVPEDMDKSDMQSLQRQYYENTLRPITRVLEETINNQIIQRYFGTDELRFKFNQPDFMKAVERSSVARRFFEIGALSPNEIRRDYLRKPPREGGDLYVEELKIASNQFMAGTNPLNPNQKTEKQDGGGPPNDRVPGSEGQERQPGDVGHSTQEEITRPDRVEINRKDFQKMMDEVRKWQKIHVEMVLGERPHRKFEFREIPRSVAEAIHKEAEVLIYKPKDKTYRLQNVYRLTGIIIETLTTFFDVIESLDENKESV